MLSSAPLWVWVSGSPEAVIQAFRKAGGKVKFTRLPDVKHDAWVAAYETDPAAFEWMLKKVRGQKGDVLPIDKNAQPFFAAWRGLEGYRAGAKQTPWPLVKGEGKVQVLRTNKSNAPVTETLIWAEKDGWTVTPKARTFIVAPGQSKTLEFTVRFSGERKHLAAVPESTSILKLMQDGRPFQRQFTSKLVLDDAAFFQATAPVYTAPKLKTAPVVDGKVDPAIWANVPTLSPLQHRFAKGPAPFKTDVKLAYDDKNLYLLVVNHEPTPKGITRRFQPGKRDQSVYRDDNIALYLQRPGMKKSGTYYHVIINPNAAVMDSIVHDRAWTPEARLATAVNPADWIVEYAVPFKDLGITGPPTGQTWGMQFERYRPQEKDGEQRNSQWTPAFGWGHQPSRFGKITFE